MRLFFVFRVSVVAFIYNLARWLRDPPVPHVARSGPRPVAHFARVHALVLQSATSSDSRRGLSLVSPVCVRCLRRRRVCSDACQLSSALRPSRPCSLARSRQVPAHHASPDCITHEPTPPPSPANASASYRTSDPSKQASSLSAQPDRLHPNHPERRVPAPKASHGSPPRAKGGKDAEPPTGEPARIRGCERVEPEEEERERGEGQCRDDGGCRPQGACGGGMASRSEGG